MVSGICRTLERCQYHSPNIPGDKVIMVDASGSGIGGSDGHYAYGGIIDQICMFSHSSLPLCIPGPEFQCLQDQAMERQLYTREPGTVKSNKSGISEYLAFCLRIGIDYLHPSYQEMCSFIEYIVKFTPAPSTIKNKMSQIRVFITLAEGSTAGFTHPRTGRALDAIERDKSHIPRIKKPISAHFLTDIIFHLPSNNNGTVVRAAILLLYYGALRQGELLPRTVKSWSPKHQVTRDDCVIHHDSITFYIKTGKNLQRAGQQREVILQRAEPSFICPVTCVNAAISLAPTLSGTDPLLMFPDNRAPMTSTYVLKQLHTTMREIGLQHLIPSTSLHSLRKSAATNAFSSGCSELSIKQYGAWASSAYQTYILTSNQKVNKSLITSLQQH